MRKILVPTDFSKNALKAISYAVEIATKSEAVIYLMHVVNPSTNTDTTQSGASNPKVIKERSDRLKMSRKTLTLIHPGVKVMPHLTGGETVQSIMDFSEKKI